MKVFKVGDTVEVNGRSEYNDRGNIPIGTIGKIKEIRRRYVNTPNEYNVYKLSFDGIPDGDDLTNNYQSMNFTKIVGKIVSMSIPEGYDVSIIGDKNIMVVEGMNILEGMNIFWSDGSYNTGGICMDDPTDWTISRELEDDYIRRIDNTNIYELMRPDGFKFILEKL